MSLTLDSFLPYRLNRLSEAVSQEIRPVYRDMHGLTRPEWRVLVALADIAPCTATDLGRHSAQHKTKISRAVQSLERRRWVRRRTSETDRRAEIVELSDMGRRAFEELVPVMRQREEMILARLPARDRAALERALAALERSMGLDGPRG